MKKTFCDRCGVECNGERLQRFTIFDVNRAIDVCEDCYSAFYQWLNNKDLVPGNVRMDFDSCSDCKYKNIGCGEDPCKNCSHNYVDKFRPDESDDGVDEFIKDVKNDSNKFIYDKDVKNCLDDLDCEGCIHCPLGWHQEPCERCIRKRYAFREKIEVNDSDNYTNKENNNEN